MIWRCKNRTLDLSRPLVMGILNVTPDSFSDGGRFATPDAAVERAAQIAAEGAAIIDIGGESTRPGAERVPAGEQIARVVPVIQRIHANLDIAVSIDTSDPEVMRAAVEAGACIVNDVSALRVPGAREVCASAGVGVCLMHMKGEPRSMQDAPSYGDVLTEVSRFLLEQRRACVAAGISLDSIVLDPGLGFGKSFAHNMTLLKEIPALSGLGSALLIGVSRKSFIGRMLGRQVENRLFGGLGLAALAVSQGARIIRAHDIAPTVDAIGAVAAVIQGSADT
ncbi:MAG: dihydropteroate synthase [Betaproteobacteria bacterium]